MCNLYFQSETEIVLIFSLALHCYVCITLYLKNKQRCSEDLCVHIVRTSRREMFLCYKRLYNRKEQHYAVACPFFRFKTFKINIKCFLWVIHKEQRIYINTSK